MNLETQQLRSSTAASERNFYVANAIYQSSHWGTASGTGYAALGINYTGYQTAVGNWIWVNVYLPVVKRALTVDTSDQAGNTGNKHSIFVSTGGSRTDNISNYHTSSYNDHCTVSNYNQQKYGMQGGVKRTQNYELQINETPDGDQILAVYRLSDGASIPFDEGNMDYIEYKA